MGGTIGVKIGKNRRKQSAAASTTSDKICQWQGVGINCCESSMK